MDDSDSLLRELRIDWETLITGDFNPLKQALRNMNSPADASSFRNLFHKMEKVMEDIIEKSYKGFSDSVLSYMESYKLNKRCSDSILSISKAVEGLLAMRIGVDDMTKEYDNAQFFEIKHGLCVALGEIKRCFDEVCNLKSSVEKEGDGEDVGARLLEAVKRSSRIYEVIDENKLISIGCIERFKEEVDAEVLDLMNLIYRRLDRYVFYNRSEYQEDFRCVMLLDGLEELEKYQMTSFEREYSILIESIIKDVSRKVQEKKLEKLVEKLMGRTQMVIRNFNNLRKMVDTTFEDLDARTKDFFGEERAALRIYSPGGEKVIEEMVQKVMERFVLEYTEEPEKHFNKENFRVENFVDDIDYASVFENKYLIHEKMVQASDYQTILYGPFTKICAPTIDTAVFMRRCAFSDAMRMYLERFLDEKYIKERINGVKRKILYLLNDDECYRSDYSNSRLLLYRKYERLISEFSCHPDLCNVSIISEFLSELVEKKFLGFFDMTFKSQIIRDSLSDNSLTEEQQVDVFKKLLVARVVDRDTLFLQRQCYENMLFAVETLRDINKPLRDERVETVRSKILMGFKFQVVLEVFYFFDLFYREGKYTNKNDYYLHRILAILEDAYDCMSKLNPQERNASLLFKCLNFYVQNNVCRLNVKSVDGLQAFNRKMRLLDEILSLIEGDGSLKESISFVEDTISQSNNSSNAKKLRERAKLA